MTAQATLYCDAAVGETRWVLSDGEARPCRLLIQRWSAPPEDPTLGRAFIGRITDIAPQFSGAFVSLGPATGGGTLQGFLPFRDGKTPKGVHEGALVRVEIAAEPDGDKSARLRRSPGTTQGEPGPEAAPDGATPTAHLGALPASPWPDISAAPITGQEARAAADAALDEALSPVIGLPDGGDLAIEPTRACIAVDVDAGARTGPADAGRFALQTNLVAAQTLARQLRLRSLAGVVVADFLSLADAASRERVRATWEDALKAYGLKADAPAWSRHGVCTTAITRGRRPVRDVVCDAPDASSVAARWSAESVALAGLRALEREGAAQRGAHLTLTLAPAAHGWLCADIIAWRAALTAQLGPRFSITASLEAAHDFVDVRAH